MTTASSTQKKDLTIVENLKLLFAASRGYKMVNVMNFLDGIAYFGILILLTLFLETQAGMSKHVTSISVSLYTGMVTLFMLGGGLVVDKLGVRRSLSWCLGIMGIGRAFLTLAPSFGLSATGTHQAAWLGMLLIAVGQGILQPAIYAGVKEYTDKRTATLGYAFLYAIMNLGILAEHFISPFIRTDSVFLNLGFTEIIGLGWGIDGVFWFCTAITGMMLLLNITLFTKKVEETQRTVDSAELKEAKDKRGIVERLRELPLTDGRLMFFIFILLPVRTIFAHQYLTIPDYVTNCYPQAVADKYEWIVGLNPLIITICVPLFAMMTRRVKVFDMMIIGTAVTAVAGFLLVPGPQLWALISYVVVFTFGEALWSSRFYEYVADIAPVGRVGAYMGLTGIPWFLAKATTGFYSGYMLEIYIPSEGPKDSEGLWLIYTLIACISPVALLLARKWSLSKKSAVSG